MFPVTQDLTGEFAIYQGDDYEFAFRLRDEVGAYIDLSGFTAKSQVRASKSSPEVIVEFTATVDPDQVANKGRITLTLTNVQTAGLAPTTSAVWDVQTTDAGGKVQTWLKGQVAIEGEVTKP